MVQYIQHPALLLNFVVDEITNKTTKTIISFMTFHTGNDSKVVSLSMKTTEQN